MSTSNVIPTFSDVLSIPSNPEDLFTLLYQIGSGGFGKVYKAMHNTTNQIFAIKIIDYTKDCISNKKNISFNYQSIQQETSVMRLIKDNDYVLKYYGSYYSRKSNTVWLILEYCACGSAVDLMLSMDRTLSEIEISTIMQMILKGLIDIHKINLIHRDIKGSNILLSENGYAKLGDFGVGIQLTDKDYRTSKKGSPYWMSPQVVLNEKYDTKTDIWSLGITCVELVEGEPPNGDLKPAKVMEKIASNPPKVEDIINENEHTDEFISFVSSCLEIDPDKRPSAAELIKHPFITKLAQGSQYLAKLIKENIKLVEQYRMEEEKREKNDQNKKEKESESEKEINDGGDDNNDNNDNDNDNENLENDIEFGENNNTNSNHDNNIIQTETSSLRSIPVNDYQENHDSLFIHKSLQNSKNDNNNKNSNNKDYIDSSYNESLLIKEKNGSIIQKENAINQSEIIQENQQNGNIFIKDKGSVIVKDDAIEGSVLIKDNEINGSVIIKDDSINGSAIVKSDIKNNHFLEYIESPDFIIDDEQYIKKMETQQREQLKEKYEELKKKINKQNEEENKNKNENENINTNNILLKDIITNVTNDNMQTPSKSNSKNTNDKLKNNNSNIIKNNKYCTDIKINNNNLLIMEEKETKENSGRNQRSCITTNFTQANSKQDSDNKYNNIPLKVKLNFDEYNKMLEKNINDTSNIDENDIEDDIIKPIKRSIINLNCEENKLEKSFEDRTKFYMKSEVKKNKKDFLQKLDFSENVNLNINQDVNDIKNIHISSYKRHKKYFN